MRINNASGYIEEINKGKYLVFNDTNESKELLKRYDDVFNGIIDEIKKMMMIGLNIQKISQRLNSIQMIIYH